MDRKSREEIGYHFIAIAGRGILPLPAEAVSDFASHPVNRDLNAERKVHLYRQMVRIRRFEQQALKNYICGTMGGFLNLQIGQEGIAVGVRSLMLASDHAIGHHRGIGHALAAGLDMNSAMAELYGKATGCSGGKAGMFSFFSPENHYWGGSCLAGGQTPLAAGFAFALKSRGEGGVAICFLGDGAVNQGVYHESLNLAGLFDLPVVYVIENNRYAMGTSVKRSSAFRGCLARRAETYGIDWDLLEGDDLYEIRARVATALDRARQHSRPTVIEILTYRYYGATVSDANHKKYRTAEEIEYHQNWRDPVKNGRSQLIVEGILDDGAADLIYAEAKAEAEASTLFAASAPAPTVGDITRNVYWELDHDTPASRIGRHLFD